MINFIRLIAVVLCLCASGEGFARKVPGGLGKELEKAWKGRDVALRGSIHQNPMTYYEHGGAVYYYAHARRYPTMFRIAKDEPVQIRSVKARDDAIEIEFVSVRLGKGQARFSAPLHSPLLNRAAFDAGFALCFKTGEDAEVLPALIGNTQSNMFHVASCNHLPDADKQQAFHTQLEAQGAGMRACKLCFYANAAGKRLHNRAHIGLVRVSASAGHGPVVNRSRLAGTRTRNWTTGARQLARALAGVSLSVFGHGRR